MAHSTCPNPICSGVRRLNLLFWSRAEMGETACCDSVAAGMRRRGFRIVAGASRYRAGRDYLGGHAGRRRLLAGDLPTAAKTDVGLRVWA